MIIDIIKEVLPKMAEEQTKKELGDRKNYIGSSDVGSCPRKSILSKKFPVPFDIETLIRFQRGHIAEEFLGNIFTKTNYKWTSQYAISHLDKEYIKAHIDFLFYTTNKNKFGVCEMKTVSSIPNAPYETWIMQVQLQMGLLKLKYPDADIKGSILALDLNSGKLAEFNGMTPDSDVFKSLVNKADAMWELLQQGETENLPTEVSELCVFCPFKGTCPRFTGAEVPENVKELVEQYKVLSTNIKELEKLKSEVQSQIIDLVGNVELAFDGNKLVVKQATSNRVDTNMLKTNYPDVYAACTKASEYTFFRVY